MKALLHSARLVTRVLVFCLVFASLSFQSLPAQAADAEADAQKAYDAWVAANEAVGQAKKDRDKAIEDRDTLLKAIANSGGKISEEQQ